MIPRNVPEDVRYNAVNEIKKEEPKVKEL